MEVENLRMQKQEQLRIYGGFRGGGSPAPKGLFAFHCKFYNLFQPDLMLWSPDTWSIELA